MDFERFERAGKRPRFFSPRPASPKPDPVREQLEAVLGPLADADYTDLAELAARNLEEAVNKYFDTLAARNAADAVSGSAAESAEVSSPLPTLSPEPEIPDFEISDSGPQAAHNGIDKHSGTDASSSVSTNGAEVASSTTTAGPPEDDPAAKWDRRYIGSFQAGVWATRAGRGLVQYDEKVGIYRSSAGDARVADFIVRVKNSRDTDFARIAEVDAKFMAILLDTGVCSFEGTCIYAEDMLRPGDTVIMQISCYLNRDAFVKDIQEATSSTVALSKPKGFTDESKEAPLERVMRQRQLGLIQLFAKVGLSTNEVPDMGAAVDLINSSASTGRGTEGDETEPELDQKEMDLIYDRTAAKLDLPEVEPADTFALTLHGYQKKALGWMLRRERGEREPEPVEAEQTEGSDVAAGSALSSPAPLHPLWTQFTWPEEKTAFYANLSSGELSIPMPTLETANVGGILADEMGLGKTISTLALIHTANAQAPPHERNTTLVVVPMSLLTQWESEINSASVPGSVRVLTYYGTRMNELDGFLSGFRREVPRIILTSYGVVASEYKQLLRFREKNGRATTNAAVSSGGPTLLGLFGTEFHRIVLDEAHNIKNRNTHSAKSCFALRAAKRWALTGTPIVNRLEDLYSLVRFLGLEPWRNFSFWKAFITTPFQTNKSGAEAALNTVQTIISPLCLRRTKDMRLNGRPLVELPEKTVEIRRIEFSRDERELYSFVFARVRSSVQDELADGTATKNYAGLMTLLMRLRQLCCHARLLPFHKELTGSSGSGKGEKSAGPAPAEDSEDAAADTTQAGGAAAGPAAPAAPAASAGLDLSDSRVVSLLDRFHENEADARSLDAYGQDLLRRLDKDLNDTECPICSAEPIPAGQLALTPCLHMACFDCFLEHIDFQRAKGEEPTCPICRAELRADQLYLVDKANGRLALRRNTVGQQSAKTKALVHELRSNRGNGKNVVFSQFTSFLDIIEAELAFHGLRTVRFDGSMNMKQRAAALDEFNGATGDIVLLLSLKAGGVGLNLVSAQQAFLMDPWWSYAVEAQAIDRIHRMGQTDNVRVVRFIIEGTIEERILRIQERKKALSSVVTDEERRVEQLENIRTLFELDDE